MKKQYSTYLFLLMALSLLLWSGCAERKNPSQPEKVHPAEWIKTDSQDFHGAKIAAAGLISCSSCHGEDYRGGTSEVSCFDCHNGPSGHPTGYLIPTSAAFHGKKIAEEGLTGCAVCHGTDYKGKANSGVSCYKCHNGPSGHPSTGFLDKTNQNFHGLSASRLGIKACAECHGVDYKGIEGNGSSCFECHNGPSGHPSSGWLDPADAKFHGQRLAATGTAYCAGCHGADFKGGDAGVSCFECHNGPSGHPSAGWLDKTNASFHGLAASTRGLSACAECHGTDFKGGTSGVSCSECHSTQSGHPASGWMTSGAPNFHGARLAETGENYCAGCHGADFKGGSVNVSCYTCHDGPSGHPATGWLDKTSETFHGLAASSRGLKACAVCHGADYLGGISGQSCGECHTDQSGHPSAGWLVQGDEHFHGARLAETGTAYCAGCHGADYKGGDAGVSCFTCHNGPSGHPASGWLSKSSSNFHGLAASGRGLPACAACHGQDFEGGISGQSCKICHADQSGHPSTGWLNSKDSNFHGLRVSQTGTQYCAGCHGADYKGGDAGVSCYTCHNGPSGHPLGWFDSKSAEFHGTKVENEGTTGCTLCHGADLSGGISGIACSLCHQ